MKILWKIMLAGILLVSCAPLPGELEPGPTPGTNAPQTAAAYPDLGPAPELTGDTWLNVAVPLRPADLGGKVVLLDMWTFG